ncbi:sugar kinase [Paenibacillus filicis]|uniref:Sugar kinase n=1 Tax=Paenibacillus gyeongsangnamensis TaxID=3388067 RepID=A0ABT4QCS3_9BACL|nr:sugar kinase [Paenibacillus filicis]MCZ8514480.1 sugar kinase [Paenibacillus filicis]
MVPLDVVTFGEAMVMFVADHPGELQQVSRFTRRLAGAEMNTAIGFARLGLKAGWVSKVGADIFGLCVKELLEAERVHIGAVQTDRRHPTGFQLKSKVSEGDPEVQYFRKGSAASRLSPGDFREDDYLGARHLHMTGIPPALSPETREYSQLVLKRMKQAGRTVSFDPNLRPSLWSSRGEMVRTVNSLAVQADWVLPGLEEAGLLTGSTDPHRISEFYLSQGVRLVVIKMGAEGAYYRSETEEGFVPGFPAAEVVDTVGAGDGFAVGTVSGLLTGLPVRQAVLRGNAIGSLAVQSSGDYEGYPTADRLEAYIQSYLNRSEATYANR